ncbi:hypothetical protein MSPP1_000637 [Malassezia sp. CBS 17886]|nr:hypothetical protein MSPP1_000637 [Malassezia sp. CBS 17886]
MLFRAVRAPPQLCVTQPRRLPARGAARMYSAARAPGGANPQDEPTLAAVKQRWKQARLAKDSDTATLLGGILTDLQYAEKTKSQPNQKPPSIIKMLQKGIKKRTDAAKMYRNAKPQPRIDLAEKEERQVSLLQELFPDA